MYNMTELLKEIKRQIAEHGFFDTMDEGDFESLNQEIWKFINAPKFYTTRLYDIIDTGDYEDHVLEYMVWLGKRLERNDKRFKRFKPIQEHLKNLSLACKTMLDAYKAKEQKNL